MQGAQMSWQKEMQAANDARQENLERLRHSNDLELAGRRESHDVAMEDKRVAANTAQAATEHQYRAGEIAGNQQFQTKVAGREEALTRERWTREDRQSVERNALSQISDIDGRILKLSDTLGEAQMKGEVMDPAGAESLKAEIAGLRQQRDQLRQETIFRLADMGDPRYKKVEAPSNAAAKGEVAPPGPDAMTPRAGAAQAAAPGSLAVTPPPPAPAEQRAVQKTARRLLSSAPVPGSALPPSKESSDTRQLLRTGFEAFSARDAGEEAVAKRASNIMLGTQQFDPQTIQALRKMDPARRQSLLKADDARLARYGFTP